MGEAAAHRRRTIGAAIWALVLLAALVVGLVYSESAQSYRRISTLSLNELQVCRDGFRFQLGVGTFANIPGPVYDSQLPGRLARALPRSLQTGSPCRLAPSPPPGRSRSTGVR